MFFLSFMVKMLKKWKKKEEKWVRRIRINKHQRTVNKVSKKSQKTKEVKWKEYFLLVDMIQGAETKFTLNWTQSGDGNWLWNESSSVHIQCWQVPSHCLHYLGRIHWNDLIEFATWSSSREKYRDERIKPTDIPNWLMMIIFLLEIFYPNIPTMRR